MPVQQEASAEIYPNPTNNTVCVVLPNEAEATEMELVNMNGQVVAAKTFSGKSSWIEMGDLIANEVWQFWKTGLLRSSQ